MGRSDPVLFRFYSSHISPTGTVALLGYTDNKYYKGDLYDKQLGNWDINSEWVLPKKYDTIICTRCAYFAKDPEDFIRRCAANLNTNGKLYVDWGLGDHWRFDKYKIGWVKEGEHEYAYGENNFLWSTIWDDDFTQNEDYKLFAERLRPFGYENKIKESIFEEVPSVLHMKYVRKYFDVSYNILALWTDSPQLYILLEAEKK